MDANNTLTAHNCQKYNVAYKFVEGCNYFHKLARSLQGRSPFYIEGKWFQHVNVSDAV